MDVITPIAVAVITVAATGLVVAQLSNRYLARACFWGEDRKEARGILANRHGIEHPTRAQLRATVVDLRAERARRLAHLYRRPESLIVDHRATVTELAAAHTSRRAENAERETELARAVAVGKVLDTITLRLVVGLPADETAALDIASDADQPLDIVFEALYGRGQR